MIARACSLIVGERKRSSIWRAGGPPLLALLVLWTVYGANPQSVSAAARRTSSCPAPTATPTGCMHPAALAHTSDIESEEPEEELEEGGEEAASAEAEAEEVEEVEAGTGTSAASGPNDGGSVVLSHLELTTKATIALAHRLPPASAIGFSFTLSAPAKVQVTIVRQASTGGRNHWSALADSLTMSVTKGRATRSLKGHNRLSPGRYRLTVKPSGGRSRSIYLTARL
jgi:hypothetical protein